MVAMMEALDDACLVHILQFLSLDDLQSARCTCSRLHRCGAVERVWQGLLANTSGVHLQGWGMEEAFRELRYGGRRCVLPMTAALTDQGCDRPWTQYWAGNMLDMSQRNVFCTEAISQNAHVLAVLAPMPAASASGNRNNPNASSLGAAAPPAAAEAARATAAGSPATGVAAADQEARHRELLIRYCMHPAAHLLRPVALAGIRLGALPYLSHACLQAARQRLNNCSTSGLEDLLLLVYSGMTQNERWGSSIARGITSLTDLGQVHQLASKVRSSRAAQHQLQIRAMDTDNQGRVLVELSGLSHWKRLRSACIKDAACAIPAAWPMATDAAASHIEPAQHHQQQQHQQRQHQQHQQRQHQPPAVVGTSCAASSLKYKATEADSHCSLGVVSELVIDPHSYVTCPVSCGVVYSMLVAPKQGEVGAMAGSMAGQHPTVDRWQEDAQSALTVLQHSWVRAMSSMMSSEQVLLAAAHGTLPPVYGHFWAPGIGEWIEFVRPSTQPRSGHAAIPAHMFPMVWFRFFGRPERMEYVEQLRGAAQAEATALQAGMAAVQASLGMQRATQGAASARQDAMAIARQSAAADLHVAAPGPSTLQPTQAGAGAASGTVAVMGLMHEPAPSMGQSSGAARQPGHGAVQAGLAGLQILAPAPAGTSSNETGQGAGHVIEEGIEDEVMEPTLQGPPLLQPQQVQGEGAACDMDIDDDISEDWDWGGEGEGGEVDWEGMDMEYTDLHEALLAEGAHEDQVFDDGPKAMLRGSLGAALSSALQWASRNSSRVPALRLLRRVLPPNAYAAAVGADDWQGPNSDISAAAHASINPLVPTVIPESWQQFDAAAARHGSSSRLSNQLRSRLLQDPLLQSMLGPTPTLQFITRNVFPVPTRQWLALRNALAELSAGAAQDCKDLHLWMGNDDGTADDKHAVGTTPGATPPMMPAAHAASPSAAQAATPAGRAAADHKRAEDIVKAAAGMGTYIHIHGSNAAVHAATGKVTGSPHGKTQLSLSGQQSAGCCATATSSTSTSGWPARLPKTPPWDWPRAKQHLLAHERAAAECAATSSTASRTWLQQRLCEPPHSPAKCVPVIAGMWEAPDLSFPFQPEVALFASEVASTFGWSAGSAATSGSLHIRLHQPWVLNGMLVKLIAAEDLRPAFNQQRGGCNIDVGCVACVGRHVQLPAQLSLHLHE